MSRWARLASLGGSEFGSDEYRCRNCDAGYDVQHHVCPNCSSFSVDPAEDVERAYETTYL